MFTIRTMLYYIFSIMSILFDLLPFSNQLYVLDNDQFFINRFYGVPNVTGDRHFLYSRYSLNSEAKNGERLLTESQLNDCHNKNFELYQIPRLFIHDTYDKFIKSNMFHCENYYYSTEYYEYLCKISDFQIAFTELNKCLTNNIKLSINACISQTTELFGVNDCLFRRILVAGDRCKFNECIYQFLESTKKSRKYDVKMTVNENTTEANPGLIRLDESTRSVLKNLLSKLYSHPKTEFRLMKKLYIEIFNDTDVGIVQVTEEDKKHCQSLITKVKQSDYDNMMFTNNAYNFFSAAITNGQMPNTIEDERNTYAVNEKSFITFLSNIYGTKNDKLFQSLLQDPLTLNEFKNIKQIIPIQNEDYKTYLLRAVTNSTSTPLTIELWKEDYDELFPNDKTFSTNEVANILKKRQEIKEKPSVITL